MTLAELLTTAVDLRGSDLHLSAGSPPRVRVDGELRPLDLPDLAGAVVKTLAYSALTGAQQKAFDETEEDELDFAFALPGGGRCRGNVFRQRGAVGAVFRLIPDAVRSSDELGLPPVVARLADLPRGLVLVAGPTGCGKSTTLAAMIDRINRTRPVHILTIEDPIEYLHRHRMGLVNQRELHADTRSFGRALRAALREDPDVVLIGELRDVETIEAALKVAETGHLTFATLHTNSAAQTVTRIIDAFPGHQQAQVRTQLSLVLEGVICQALLPAAGRSGRVAALEILVVTPAIRHLIRDDKVHQIYGAMQAGQERLGTQTMNQALARLCERRLIARDLALSTSPNRDELAALLERATRDKTVSRSGTLGGRWPSLPEVR